MSESEKKPDETPYAVLCRRHGRVFLTQEQYRSQMMAADSRWACPTCGQQADWDDENYEKHTGGDDAPE